MIDKIWLLFTATDKLAYDRTEYGPVIRGKFTAAVNSNKI